MKLKVVMASLIALGVSSPLLAVDRYDANASYQNDVLRDQINKLDLILEQNQPGGFEQPCGWTCRINVSGWINADAYLANRPPVFLTLNPLFEKEVPVLVPTTGRASDLLLNNANLFVDTRVNNWVTANMSLIYSSLTAIPGSQGFYSISNSHFVYHPVSAGTIVTRSIDTAYATLGNFQTSPIYFRLGKEYIPFGQYDPYSFVQSENPTQLITEINAPTAQLGFIIPNSFYGSVYTFAGNPKVSDASSTRRIQNGGIDLGYRFKNIDNEFNIDAGYIANIADSNFISSYYTNSIIEVVNISGLPNQKTPAYDVNASINFGPFDASAHYVATTSSLQSPIGIAFLPVFEGEPIFLKKPKAWGLEAGYSFPFIEHQSRLAIGYQATKHLPGFLPKQRIYADWMVNVAKWFDIGVSVFQNKDYNVGEGDVTLEGGVLNPVGTGNKATVGQLRASIKFA